MIRELLPNDANTFYNRSEVQLMKEFGTVNE